MRKQTKYKWNLEPLLDKVLPTVSLFSNRGIFLDKSGIFGERNTFQISRNTQQQIDKLSIFKDKGNMRIFIFSTVSFINRDNKLN